jgi:uncharacterized protein (UPF0335 family)
MCDACEAMIAELERIEARDAEINAEIKKINELLGIIGQ